MLFSAVVGGGQGAGFVNLGSYSAAEEDFQFFGGGTSGFFSKWKKRGLPGTYINADYVQKRCPG